MFWVIYLIVGISLLTYSGLSQARKYPERMKNKFRDWVWWLVTIGCVVAWPVLLGSAIVDIVRILKDGSLEEFLKDEGL